MKKFVIIIIVLIIVFVNLYLMGLTAQKRLEENKKEYISETMDEKVEIDVADDVKYEIENIAEEKKEIVEETKVAEGKNETKPKEIKKEKENNKVVEKNTPSNEKSKEEPTVIITEETKENVFVEKEEVVIQKENVVEEKKEITEEVKVAEKVKIVEEYKINNGKITEIENIIKNNPTEDMLKYGYNVVVDSSIVNMTNQFTFTEKRVKDKIAWKFGTIKIYAQDYYCNGEYVCTECFII